MSSVFKTADGALCVPWWVRLPCTLAAVGRSVKARPKRTKPIDQKTFFAIMGAFPTGVTVVTAMGPDGRPRGLTVSAVVNVSEDPPTLLVCIDKNSNTLPAIRHSGRFAVNYLVAGRDGLAELFASKEPEKFAHLRWRLAGNGMPWLEHDAFALAECAVTDEVEGGDHVIFFGRLEGGSSPDPDARPLIYYRKAYGSA
jgi:flavin reductase (NADH)